MKRLLITSGLILVFTFAGFSVAYLSKPINLSIDIDKLSTVQVINKRSFIKAGWGKAEDEFEIDKQDWLPGPMSLTADAKDSLYILDQQNKRIKEYSAQGRLVRIISIDSYTYEDIAIDEDGFIYLLDAAENHLVKKINKQGQVIRTYAIHKDIEPISALVLADGKVYVEVEHDKVFSIGTQGEAKKVAEQNEDSEEGRPAEDFTTDTEVSNGEVTGQITGRHRLDSFKITGSFESSGAGVYSIISIDSDNDGNLYIVLNVASSEQQFDEGQDKLLGLVIDKEGKLKNRFYASNQYYTSHFRKIAVSPNGTIYQMLTSSDGVEIWRY